MTKNIVIALLSIFCVGLIALQALKKNPPKAVASGPDIPLEVTPEATEPESPFVIPEIPPPLPEPEKVEVELAEIKVEKLEEETKELSSLLGEASELIEGLEEENEEVKKKMANSPFARMKEMMKSPEMQEMMKTQAGSQIDSTYGKLFERLDLDTATSAEFKEMLLERQFEHMQNGMSFMDLDKEGREARGKEMEAMEEEYKAEMTKLLGADGRKEFEKWEKEMPKRESLKQVSMRMGEAKLSDEQTETLVELMTRRDEQLAKEDQREGFQKGLDAQLQMMKFGMKMGSQFIGDGEE